MSKSLLYILILIVLLFQNTYGQQHQKTDRILIVLNGGATMQQAWSEGSTKYKVANSFVTALIDSMWHINKEVQFGLRVFGHLDPIEKHNCNNSRREVNFTKDNLAQVSLRIEDIKPKGTGSASYALQKAIEEDLINPELYNYTVILLTDSSSMCNEAICAIAEKLHLVTSRTYVIQLEGNVQIKFGCLGRALEVATKDEIKTATSKILEPYRKMYFSQAKIVHIAEAKPDIPLVKTVATPKRQIRKNTTGDVQQVNPIEKLQASDMKLMPNKVGKVNVRQVQEPERPYKYGYVKFVNAAGIHAVTFSLKKGSEYVFYLKFESEDLNNKRFKIRDGKYKAVYNDMVKELIILPNMITELDLR